MDMMRKLVETEMRLPDLLRDGKPWKTLWITYHPPFVERLWRQWGECRICLHTIHALEEDEKREPLFHPHYWPSAMRVHDSYTMNIGYGDPDGPTPPVILTQNLAAGSTYAMEDPWTWHSVRPPTKTSRSTMVIGPLYEGLVIKPSPLKERVELTKGMHDNTIELFQEMYPRTVFREHLFPRI